MRYLLIAMGIAALINMAIISKALIVFWRTRNDKTSTY